VDGSSEKIIATLLVPAGAFCDTSGQAEADPEADHPVEKPSSVRVNESLFTERDGGAS
jgi:hypothetical protein